MSTHFNNKSPNNDASEINFVDNDDASEISTLPPPVDEIRDQDEDLVVEENQIEEDENNQNKDQGPAKVFVYLGCAIILLFLLKELMGLFVLLAMLNIMMFAIDPVGTQELRRTQLEASKIIFDEIKRKRKRV